MRHVLYDGLEDVVVGSNVAASGAANVSGKGNQVTSLPPLVHDHVDRRKRQRIHYALGKRCLNGRRNVKLSSMGLGPKEQRSVAKLFSVRLGIQGCCSVFLYEAGCRIRDCCSVLTL